MDVSPKYLRPDEAYYLLNHNTAPNNDGAAEVNTPFQANYPLCEMEAVPVGENYAPNTFESKRTNELYSWVLNTNDAHYIQRINDKGECEVVYQDECLMLSADPKHAIYQFRAHMKIDEKCSHAHGKQLIWTNGLHAIGQIDVEASIETNFFSTPFFTNQCSHNPCAYIQHCVPQLCDIITAEYVPLPATDKSLSNKLNNRSFQFIYRHVYYDNRANEWSEPSTLYYQDTDGCFDGDEGLPRCIKLRIPIGNPMVEKIEIGYRENSLIDSSDQTTRQWKLYETVEKYNPYTTPSQYWYERTLAPIITSSLGDDCAFDFFFCNDKQCQIIPIEETSRTFNPMPRKPQGILEVKDSLGFYNYEQGNCPVSESEIRKLTIEPVCENVACQTELVSVTVRAIITATGQGRTNQFVWRENGIFGDADDENDTAYFGGVGVNFPDDDILQGWGQEFPSKRRNFIVYIEGTNYFGEMEQWVADRTATTTSEYGVISGMANENTPTIVRDMIRKGQWFFQQYTFRVPKGTRGWIRIANQDTAGGYSLTSAGLSVNGLHADYRNYRVNDSRVQDKEIYFDTCDAEGDVDIKTAFDVVSIAIEDENTIGILGANCAFSGYVSDSNNKRVEFAEIWGNVGGSYKKLATTDWNGFYFFYAVGDVGAVTLDVKVEQDCTGAWQTIKSVSVIGEPLQLTKADIQIIKPSYANGFYEKVLVPVYDCDGNLVSGVRVAMSGSKYSISVNGIAEFKVRNKVSRDRRIKVIVMDRRGCFSIDCNGECNYCLPESAVVQLPQCFPETPNELEVLLNGNINITPSNENLTGLKMGGRYPFGVVVKGDCGRQSAVYELPIMDVPKIQEVGRLQFCDYRYNGNGITLPDWGTCLLIVRGENTNRYELQWVVDKVERTVDNKIKLTVQSLSDYNSSYFFKTNTIYQWLKGDRIEFTRNGDGEVFDVATHGILNYLTVSPFHDKEISGEEDAPADFFNQLLIEDDGKLDSLTEGAIIELQRAAECTTDPVYFSIGVSIPIVDGKLVQETGTFHTFDTFIVRRVVDGSQSQQFEHHSPSDFWGDHISDIGQSYFTNKYENERRYGRNITLNSPTQFNFYGNLVKRFDAPGQGDIVAMDIKDGRIILAICEHDNFLAEAADDLVRVGNDGTIRALPPDAIISDGQPKVSGQYGCQYPHIGSIYFGDGWATYVDVNKHSYIVHDYQSARIAGESVVEGMLVTQCSSFFKKRCQELESFNRGEADFYNHIRFSTGYNKYSKAVYLTIKSLRQAGYNNESEPYAKQNETIVYRPISNDFLTFSSATPEGYGGFDMFNETGCSMVTFQNAIPHIHPIIADKWNEFYGVPCDWIVGVSLNKYPEKVKRGLALEIQSQTMWYVKDVRTEVPTFVSEIPAARMKKFEDKWNGGFLGNSNSREGLYGNPNLPRGYYVKILLIRDNTDQLKYNIFDNTKRTAYSELDNILTKFTLSEQSGFTSNI